MRFLVMTEPNSVTPPEMVLPLIGAMEAWVARHRAAGKFKETWSNAGRPGGGAIVEVESPEELDVIMAGFPFGPFSAIKVYAMSDLDRGLVAFRSAVQERIEMMGGKPQRGTPSRKVGSSKKAPNLQLSSGAYVGRGNGLTGA